MKIKIGDEVLVTAGKDKGRKGKIEKIFFDPDKVLVPGVNLYKKHQKGYAGQKGGVFELPRPLPVSNVALVCPKCNKQTRVGYRIDARGQKERVCQKCDAALETQGGKK